MRRRSTSWFFPAIALAATLGASPAFGQFLGSLLATDSSGNPVANNVFSTRDQVFFTAGPADAACSIGALPDGVYAFQVTDASGATLLSTDSVASRMFLVAGGVIADNAPGGTHVASSPVTSCGSHVAAISPFNLAPRQTGVYKLWVQPASFCGDSGCDFLPQNSDTVNFVVREKARCLATHCVSGLVFSDTNENGTQDAGDPGLPGVLVVARDSRGIANTAVTGTDGTFSICGLTETSYTISEVVPTGYQQTAPAGSSQISRYLRVSDFTYLLTICNANTSSLNFGNFPLPGSISGMKFNDANGNGLLDPGEAGVGGVTIQLFSGSDAEGSPLATAVTDGSGNFSFTNLAAGSYSVTEVLPSGYRQTSPSLLGRGFYAVSLAPGQNIQGILFGNQLISQFGAISGMKFNDVNGNGVLDPGELGLAGVTIVLQPSGGAPITTVTDSAGNFSFQNLAPGSYTLSEIVPNGYQQTLPPPPGTMTVTVTAGNTVSNVLFGNQFTVANGSISGFVYYDFNKNTVQDPSEKGLPDVTMNLFDLSNHLVATTTTDANGLFTFQNVPAGDYTVSPVPPEKFFQTVPPNKAPINVHVDSGQQVTGLVFGLTC